MSIIAINRPPTFSSAHLRQAYACFPSGVIALCGMDDDGTPQGMAISSFGTVSLEPALVQVCIQGTSATWPRLKRMYRLGVSVLAADQAVVARRLASKTEDRFAGGGWEANDNGAVFLRGSALQLETSFETEAEAGDHTISLLRIWSVESRPEVTPLVFQGSAFHGLNPEVSGLSDEPIAGPFEARA